MNSRWTVRILGLIVLVVMLALLFSLQKRLLELQRTRRPAATSTR